MVSVSTVNRTSHASNCSCSFFLAFQCHSYMMIMSMSCTMALITLFWVLGRFRAAYHQRLLRDTELF